MEAIRKQASKLREQVARQQQAVLKQLGHFDGEAMMMDEADTQCHQQLQNLYTSTKAAKHFQRNIVRGIAGFISTSTKQMEIVKRLAEDCYNFGENHDSAARLARAVLVFGSSRNLIEDERDTLLGILHDQVSERLRTLITGAPLEDARHLTHRYEKLHHEVEAQAAEVLRRRSKSRDSDISSESGTRLQSAEERLTVLKSTMAALGKEATAAMLSVEDQQQQITYQQILAMVDAERYYHQKVVIILEKLHAEMILEKQPEPAPHSTPSDEYPNSRGSDEHPHTHHTDSNFIAKVIHPFDAQADGELSLSVDDYVVVRQADNNGWSEGECRGRSGWFPSAYVENEEKALVSKIIIEEQNPQCHHPRQVQ